LNTPNYDLVAFGPHPDDVEIFCGGIVAISTTLRQRVAIVDLTAGETASSGTPEQRAAEAAEAAKILGVAHRECLGLPDGRLNGADDAQVERIVAVIRALRPRVVLGPWERERHPDHVAASQLLARAVFLAGLTRYPIEGSPRHVCEAHFQYPMRVRAELSFLVDTSEVHATKIAAIAAHRSQIGEQSGNTTLIGGSGAIDAIVARDRYVGTLAGTQFAEGLVSRRIPVVDDVVALFADRSPAHFFEQR
jgi:bacillithiol biosynthesis deacetylase BshB1